MKSTCDLHRSLVYVYLDWNLNTALKKKVFANIVNVELQSSANLYVTQSATE